MYVTDEIYIYMNVYVHFFPIVLCGFQLDLIFQTTFLRTTPKKMHFFHWNNKICPFILIHISKTKHTLNFNLNARSLFSPFSLLNDRFLLASLVFAFVSWNH